jgi:predicted Zn-dependent protease
MASNSSAKSAVSVTLAALILLLIGQGCTTVPITGRQQVNLISQGQEMQLGLASFEAMKKETPIDRDAKLNAMLQDVGHQIAAAASNDMPNAQWEFVLFDSKEANAFCLPGGKVGVYKGILPITKDRGGLATVIGHEVAHAVARHGGERMTHSMIAQGGGELANVAVSAYDPRWQGATKLAYGAISKVGFELPFSRKQELEADHMGLVYMARAGYDPEQAVAFWKRFMEYSEQQGGANVPALLRTHPVDSVRIKQLQELLPTAQAEFSRNKQR